MEVHDYDFILGSDAIFITKDAKSGMKVNVELVRLTECTHSQQVVILLHDDNIMMFMQILEVCPKSYS